MKFLLVIVAWCFLGIALALAQPSSVSPLYTTSKATSVVTQTTMPSDTVVALSQTWTNNSGLVGQGAKEAYFTNATASGFDLGRTTIIIPTATAGFPVSGFTGFQAQWNVAMTPNITGGAWNLTGQETDVVNRNSGLTWARSISAGNAVTAYLAVPEATTFGQGGNTYNGLIAFDASQSGGNGTLGDHNRWYNDFVCEPNSEAAVTGRCLYATGDITGSSLTYPYGPIQFDGAWLHGLDATLATFSDNNAMLMAAGSALAWPAGGGFVTGTGASGNGTVALEASGTGEIDLRDASANVRAKMTSTTVDLGVSGTGANFRVANAVTNLVSTDVSTYSTAGNTITNNVAVAPDGTTTAALMATAVANAVQYRYTTFTGANSVLYTATVYAKSQPLTNFPYVALYFGNAGFSNGSFGIVANTSTCAFANYVFASGLDAPTSYSVTNVGNGWCRVVVSQRASSASSPYVLQIANAQGYSPSFLGDGTGIYVWKPTVETTAENFVKAVGSASGADAALTMADSGDTNANLDINCKGTCTVKLNAPVLLQPYTVATLPACAAGTKGSLAYVTDANALTFGATLVGGGSIIALGFCNGTNWTTH